MGARNIIRLLQEGLIPGEQFDLTSSDSLQWLPEVNDQGKMQVGNGTTDMDFQIYLGADGSNVLFDSGNKAVTMTGVSMSGSRKVTDLTANTTISATQLNGVITNRGAAGAITVTLPDAPGTGAWLDYRGVADQDITFATNTADTLIILNDAAADSLAFSTAGNKIGAAASFIFDGTGWHATDLKGTATTAT